MSTKLTKKTKKVHSKSATSRDIVLVNPPLTETRTSEAARAFDAKAIIAALFAHLGIDRKASVGSSLNMTKSVPVAFIEEAASVKDAHPHLINVQFDTTAARSAIAYAFTNEPVATEVEALARGIRHAIAEGQAEAGSAALAVYAAMKAIVDRPEGAPIAESHRRMSSIMKQRRRSRKAPEAPAATTAPVVAPTTTVTADTTSGTTTLDVKATLGTKPNA